MSKSEDDKWALEFARIECHFFHHRGWMEDGQLLKKENVKKIQHIPTIVVQGRYDVVCPAKSAWDLRQAWIQVQEEEQGAAKDTFEVGAVRYEAGGTTMLLAADHVVLCLSFHTVLRHPRCWAFSARARHHGSTHLCD